MAGLVRQRRCDACARISLPSSFEGKGRGLLMVLGVRLEVLPEFNARDGELFPDSSREIRHKAESRKQKVEEARLTLGFCI